MTHYKEIPSAKGLPLLGNLLDMREPLSFFMKAAQTHGGLIRLRFGRQQVLLVSEPDYVKHILLDNYHNYIRGTFVQNARLLLGNGLAMVDGNPWLQQRRLMQPAFHKKRLAQLVDTIGKTVDDWVARWPQGTQQPIDLAEEMMTLTLRIIVKTMFSLNDERTSDTLANAFNVAQAFIYQRTYSIYAPPMWVPTPKNRRFLQAVETVDAIIYQLIAQRRQHPAGTADLLSMLLEARDAENGTGMSDKQLRDEIITFFFAGHETTATTLAWAWYVLMTNEEINGRFYTEISTVLNGRLPTFADLIRLSYTHQLFQETLRFYSPVWIFARQSVANDVIDGYLIPANSNILISPYITHHNSTLWPNPDAFDVHRFDAEKVSQRNRFAFYPFGGGAHLCIGQNFATMEAQIILAHIAQSFELSLVPGHPIAYKPEVTNRPRHGILATLRPRSS